CHFQRSAPLNRAALGKRAAQGTRTSGYEVRQLPHMRQLLRRGPTYLLDDVEPPAPRSGGNEVARLEASHQRSKVCVQRADLDLRVRRSLAAREIEQQCDADVVDVFEPRRIH